MHYFVTEMCTFLLQNDVLWDMGLGHYRICEMGLLEQGSVPYGETCRLRDEAVSLNDGFNITYCHRMVLNYALIPNQCRKALRNL